METLGNDHITVFMPGAPDPSSGVVQIVGVENVTRLNVSRQDALACMKRSGRGLPGLLARTSSIIEPFRATCPRKCDAIRESRETAG